MDLGLSGKVVLISGGSKGIGLACAEAFKAEGARIAITSRDPANIAEAQKKLGQVLAIPSTPLKPPKSLRPSSVNWALSMCW